MTSMFQMIEMMNTQQEREVGRLETGNFIVDTCAVNDGIKPYETAISHIAVNQGRWAVVESYDTVDEAKIGHEKWVSLIESGKIESIVEVENRITENDFTCI